MPGNLEIYKTAVILQSKLSRRQTRMKIDLIDEFSKNNAEFHSKCTQRTKQTRFLTGHSVFRERENTVRSRERTEPASFAEGGFYHRNLIMI